MLETTRILTINTYRNLIRNIQASPFLYLFFSLMIIFSTAMFALLTIFLSRNEVVLSLEDLFFSIFFIFIIKASADFHTHFIKSLPASYALSTPTKQLKTIIEIFLAVCFFELMIWFTFSLLYIAFLVLFRFDASYLLLYTYFSLGVFLAVCLGSIIALHFFSPHKEKLLIIAFLLLFYWMAQNIPATLITIPGVSLYMLYSFRQALFSYLFVNRKNRQKEQVQARLRSRFSALFYREAIVLWRERLFASFIFSAIGTATFTGYFAVYGAEIFFPESIQRFAGQYLPSMFVFLGLYVVVTYTSVFPALNLFLTEEKTMWILRNNPIDSKTIVYGKVSVLLLCFVTSLPFLAYIMIFVGTDNFWFLLWLLIFAYIAGVIISVPLSVKYVGKKSDILLLYTVAMILFVLVSAAAALGMLLTRYVEQPFVVFLLVLLVEGVLLWVSLNLAIDILKKQSKIPPPTASV